MDEIQSGKTIGSSRGGNRRRVAVAVGGALFATVSVVALAGPDAAFAKKDTIDTGSLSSVSQIVGAQDMWNAGYFGQGVGVAVLDTGVARVPGLDQAGKVIDGPDLSLDSQTSALQHNDAFGHGTHIAGIIAGSDVAPGLKPKGCKTCLGDSPYTDTTKFVGIAPEAKIINVKVGAYDGTVDVTQVIAGIDWVIQHRNDNGLNIRVLNLSFGTDSVQSADIDPLAYAVDVAWKHGIVVVAAGGNDGEVGGALADPAISPSIISVGSTDPAGTLKTSDDTVADFAQHGTTERGIDIVAPGVSVTSLRVPNGFIDSNVTTGKVGDRFQRGSGTSQSTAIVSGLVALILSKAPNATPDAVKYLLEQGASALKKDANPAHFSGAGEADLSKLATMNDKKLARALTTVFPSTMVLTGTGSIDASRGSEFVLENDQALQGEFDIFGQPWDSAAIATQSDAEAAWNGGTFNGSIWAADTWSGSTWGIATWQGNDFAGVAWGPNTCDGTEWTGARWSGARWSGARWSGARWSGARWSGARWSGARWSGARWSSARWSSASWD